MSRDEIASLISNPSNIDSSGKISLELTQVRDLLETAGMGEYILRVLSIAFQMDFYEWLWWRTDKEYAPVTFLVNCNDLFSWATADCEKITPENISELERAVADALSAGDDMYGPELFCARVRASRPQGAAYPKDSRLWPLFDACGPPRAKDFNNPHSHRS